MPKQYRIWDGMLIPEEKVEKMLLTGEDVLILRGVDLEKIDSLNQTYRAWRASENGYEVDYAHELEEFFDSIGIEAEVENTDFFEEIRDAVAFSPDNQMFFNLSSCDEVDVYRWWNGSDWQTEWCDPDTIIETVVVISDDYVNLDAWNGSNFVTYGTGGHVHIHRVLELDGETVSNHFLIKRWTQYQGDHPTGEVVTIDEIPAVLKHYGKDIDEYLPKIKKLEV